MRGSSYTDGSELIILKGSKNEPLIIAGYASVDVVDKQNDLITLEAIREASADFMKGDYRNVKKQKKFQETLEEVNYALLVLVVKP
jgi:hypothetical protein